MRTVMIVGGTGGIGQALAASHLADGDRVVVSGRDTDRAGAVAADLATTYGGTIHGIGTDLSRPNELDGLTTTLDRLGVATIDTLVLAAMQRDVNSVKDYDIAAATALVTIKLVGYTAVVHLLRQRMAVDGSVLLFGGRAKDVPYPGSTTVTTVNAAVTGLVSTLAVELAPTRVNAIHLGIVGDSPFWQDRPEVLTAEAAATLTGRLTTTAEAVDACRFLSSNTAANRIDLRVDGGFH